MKYAKRLACALALLSALSFAQVPATLSYQGIMTDGQGQPVADGSYDLTFSIYDDIAAATPLWTETRAISITNGLFSTILGDQLAIDLSFDVPYFLGIGLEDEEEMTPRASLTASPYSLRSLTADTAGFATGFAAPVFVSGSESDPVIWAENTGTSYGLYGTNTGSGNAVGGVATQDGLGVYGFSTDSHGVYAKSLNTTALYAEGETWGANLVGLGSTSRGVVATGELVGVEGQTTDEDGTGVFGATETGYGVRGFTHGSGHGVYGHSIDTGHGVYGFATAGGTGVRGESGSSGPGISALNTASGYALYANSTGSGTTMRIEKAAGSTGVTAYIGNFNTGNSNSCLFVSNSGTGPGISTLQWGSTGSALSLSGMNSSNASPVLSVTNVGTGLVADFGGNVEVDVLQIAGGSDIAEPFDFRDDANVDPGTVMVIDPDHPGELRISEDAYDRRVAGIVSGAGGVKPGLTLQQSGVMEGRHPVALAGRVYCKAEANSGAIKPGDLLTTSNLDGHAMKASDAQRSNGSIIGKAMSGLESGTGLVLVLVNLQ